MTDKINKQPEDSVESMAGSVSLTELEQFVDEMGVDESKCLVGDHGVGFAFGFADAVAQLTAFVQQKKQNDSHQPEQA